MRLALRALLLARAFPLATAAGVADPGFDIWGGWRGIMTSASGRFRIERLDGVWWLITPAGHGFFSIGVDHLRPEGDFSPPLGTAPYHDNILARYGSDAAWATATSARLTDLRVNTIGAFSQPELFPARSRTRCGWRSRSLPRRCPACRPPRTLRLRLLVEKP
jgi:hypothetical protein